MKRLSFVLIIVSMLAAACSSDRNDQYVINGTVKGIPDLEYVYLRDIHADVEIMDSALVTEGKFKFVGEQSKTVPAKYISFRDSLDMLCSEEIFLEPGEITVVIDKDKISVSGTVSNDARGPFLAEFKAVQDEIYDLFRTYSTNDSLSKAQKEEIENEMIAKDKALEDYVCEQMKAYAGTYFGTYLLVSNGRSFDAALIDSLMAKVPECQREDKRFVDLNEYIQAQLNSRPGKKFTDVSLMTPDSTAVQLSDYIGKDRYVLMVFWGSWNKNCCDGMPLLVSAYKELHPKGLEILGFYMDVDKEALESMVEGLGMTWAQFCEPEIWQGKSPKAYAVNSMPTLLLLDKSGTIVSRLKSIPEMIEKMKELIK